MDTTVSSNIFIEFRLHRPFSARSVIFGTWMLTDSPLPSTKGLLIVTPQGLAFFRLIALARQLKDGCSTIKRKEGPASFQAKKGITPDDVCLACVGNYMPKKVCNYRRCKEAVLNLVSRRAAYT
ncbi:hypothetical protein TNCV_5116421 [Trichonephila clavipes]|nr:hypothetical protein TNCV_5116421 [Trichonephila clavipes]